MQIGAFELPLPRNIVNGIQKDISDNDTSFFNGYAREMQNHRIRDEEWYRDIKKMQVPSLSVIYFGLHFLQHGALIVKHGADIRNS